MKRKYIIPTVCITFIGSTFILAGSGPITDGRYSDNSQAGGWAQTGTSDASSGSQFNHGQSSDGTGNRAKGHNAWDTWDE